MHDRINSCNLKALFGLRLRFHADAFLAAFSFFFLISAAGVLFMGTAKKAVSKFTLKETSQNHLLFLSNLGKTFYI